MEETEVLCGSFVTVAGDSSIGINQNNRLVHFPTNERFGDKVKDLGPATAENIQSLIYALKRLEKHCV